jgi:hypothetical protein
VSRSDGKVLGDYTTAAAEDEFSFFPGLLRAPPSTKDALANGDARIVGQGQWHGMPVYWVELTKGRRADPARRHRPGQLPASGISRAQPGWELRRVQVGVLGFDYVSNAQANFDTAASVLVSGRVLGPDCRPAKARVGAFLGGEEKVESSAEIASARTGANGSFTLTADPRRSPFREALAGNGRVNVELYVIAGKNAPKLIGFTRFSRAAKRGPRWVEGAPVTIHASKARQLLGAEEVIPRASQRPGQARPEPAFRLQ